MKFDTPAGTNPIDQLKVVGQPVDRVDGPLKTTGLAPYAYERHDVVNAPAYGYIVGAAVAKGRIQWIDTVKARLAPGVLAVVTAENAGPVDKGAFYAARPLAGPEVDHYHQAVAVVVAETFEQARSAAALVRVKYTKAAGAFDLAQEAAKAPQLGDDAEIGDFDTAFAAAPVQIDGTYATPDQSHAMMEPHATTAVWDGDKVTLYSAIQLISWATRDLAKILAIPKDNIRVVSPYVGGGFGGKATVIADAVMACLGAKAAGRPVKVALPRHLMFNNTSHRPATVQRIRIGATEDGKITAIAHESLSGNLKGGGPERAVQQTRILYAGANRLTRMRLAHLDLPEGNAMRAPGEASGMMALEIAMDEAAERLGMDPVAFRVLNDTQVDPERPSRPFSTRRFVECLERGAKEFGWSERNPKPAARREGAWLIGLGMAGAIRGNPVGRSAARVRLSGQGQITVETDMTDIGTGSYTIIAQTAAEMMGVTVDRVTVSLGDSAFPVAAGSGGQWGANSSTSGVYAACVKLREAVATKLGLDPSKAEFVAGEVRADKRKIPLAKAAEGGEIVAEDFIEFAGLGPKFAQQTFGAHFVEVGVHAATGETRVRRMLAVCAAGRILNPKTARSQVIGAMTMGVGAALSEHLVVDTRHGFFVNHDLAGYEVPVHADIPHQQVIFLDEVDPVSSPMKAKGVGELGISGVAAAVANAIYNATGVRVRDYPITVDKLLNDLPKMA